jgi:hypothetical protein
MEITSFCCTGDLLRCKTVAQSLYFTEKQIAKLLVRFLTSTIIIMNLLDITANLDGSLLEYARGERKFTRWQVEATHKQKYY